MVILVCGLPGSGKSFFAERLAQRLDAAWIASDVLRRELLPERTYTPEEKARVYDAMVRAMQDVPREKDVVLDATFYKRAIRDKVSDAARAAGRDVRFVEIKAAEAVARDRLTRTRPYSEADYGVYRQVRDAFEPLQGPHLVLESREDNIDDMLARAQAWLRKHD